MQATATPECVHFNANYPGVCHTSGQHYRAGKPVAYYSLTRKSHILMRLFPPHQPVHESPQSPVFKYIEGAFDKWLRESHPIVKKTYEIGDLDRKGAILQALSDAEDLAHETGMPVWLHECDLASSFFV